MRHLNRVLLASTALGASMVASAFAADLPSHKAPPAAFVAPPVFTWTGFYVGANAGAVWTKGRVDDLMTPANYGALFGNTDSRSPSGLTGGLQAGYNYQIQNFVFGAEADFNFSAANSNSGVTTLFNNGFVTHKTALSSFGTARLRAGVAFDRFLPFITGGVAFANFNDHLIDSNQPFDAKRSSSSVGWTLGGGLEYAIDNHWSVKAEYLFLQFPSATTTVAAFGNYSFRFRNNAQVARVGVNFRF